MPPKSRSASYLDSCDMHALNLLLFAYNTKTALFVMLCSIMLLFFEIGVLYPPSAYSAMHSLGPQYA